MIPAFGLVSSGDLERHLPLRDLLATDRWLFATPTDDALVQHLARGSEVMQLRTSTQALRLDPDAVAFRARLRAPLDHDRDSDGHEPLRQLPLQLLDPVSCVLVPKVERKLLEPVVGAETERGQSLLHHAGMRGLAQAWEPADEYEHGVVETVAGHTCHGIGDVSRYRRTSS